MIVPKGAKVGYRRDHCATAHGLTAVSRPCFADVVLVAEFDDDFGDSTLAVTKRYAKTSNRRGACITGSPSDPALVYIRAKGGI